MLTSLSLFTLSSTLLTFIFLRIAGTGGLLSCRQTLLSSSSARAWILADLSAMAINDAKADWLREGPFFDQASNRTLI